MTTTYRFKFSKPTQDALVSFSDTHRLDDIPTFRRAWKNWVDAHSELIEREKNDLEKRGYTKSTIEKMYRSVRYYFKSKSTSKKEPKKRAVYRPLNRALLEDMTRHVREVAMSEKYKPAHAYNNFYANDRYNNNLKQEKERIQTEWGLTELEVEEKVKKTYKNRFYLVQKNI